MAKIRSGSQIKTTHMEVTNRELGIFFRAAKDYRAQFTKESKLTTAIAKFIKKHKDKMEDYQDKDLEIRRELAAIDEKGYIISDEKGNYRYSPTNQKELIRKLRILEREKVEIEPCIATEVPSDLSLDWIDLLTPFVIAEPQEIIMTEVIVNDQDIKVLTQEYLTPV